MKRDERQIIPERINGEVLTERIDGDVLAERIYRGGYSREDLTKSISGED